MRSREEIVREACGRDLCVANNRVYTCARCTRIRAAIAKAVENDQRKVAALEEVVKGYERDLERVRDERNDADAERNTSNAYLALTEEILLERQCDIGKDSGACVAVSDDACTRCRVRLAISPPNLRARAEEWKEGKP